MNRESHSGISEQRRAGQHRLADARILMDAGRWRGAMYMAGYSVECLLKARLMDIFGCHQLGELEEELRGRKDSTAATTVFTHQLETLLRLTGATDRLRQNQANWRAFGLVNEWVPAWRYNPGKTEPDDACDFLEAVGIVLHWIEHNV